MARHSERNPVRRTGRTTRILQRVCEALYEGQYDTIFFTVHHRDFDSYCMRIIGEHFNNSAMYTMHNRRAHMKNRYGQLVHIQFINRDWEQYAFRGFSCPIARDHHVIHEAIYDRSAAEELRRGIMMAAGYDPMSTFAVKRGRNKGETENG